MNRTRLIFIGIVLLALVVVGGGWLISRSTGAPANPNVPTATVPPSPTPVIKSPTPIWGAQYKAGDGKPTYICGTDAFASYLTLLQIQSSGIDVAKGFHLGIIPLQLPRRPEYALAEETSDALVQSGAWDCVLNTVDSVATSGNGVITAIIDESAGGDGIYARGINTINELKGKRIAFVKDSSAEYFVYYILSVARLNAKFDVTLVPADTPDDAVKLFNDGKADAVSAWEPQLGRARSSGGAPLITTNQLRLVVDVIITSRKSVAERPQVVQMFHDAWFDALKRQADGFDAAAAEIVKWGNPDWTEVRSPADLRNQMKQIAQADITANAFVMRDPSSLVNRINISRRVWAAAGVAGSPDKPEDLIDPRFVAAAAQNAALRPGGALVNDTFSMSSRPDFSKVNVRDAATLAVLPCREFKFLPESTTLTLESRRVLDDCVVPTLQQSVGLYLRVRGSSAWPGPKGSFTEKQILDFATARAQSVVDYLATQHKVDRARFVVEGVLPPKENWESDNPDVQERDRFVEMVLVTSGR
jgi:ABC-type nitrate/sulfonate/bicarbonate transport system substrate-binding protein